MPSAGSIPSAELDDALSALDRLLEGKQSLSTAVAFVRQSGVDLLAELLDRHPEVKDLQVVARGAPITDPNALLSLRDRLNAKVSVIAGAEAFLFHPKLWLLRGESPDLHVLSGSGNLTEGGLRGNREQHEILHFTDARSIESQERRFELLSEGAVPLDRFEGSIAWREWKSQMRKRRELLKKLHLLDESLAASHPESREADKDQLLRDLWDVHDRTVAAKLRKDNGHLYVPGGLRLQIEGKRGEGDPVRIAARICRKGTDGFDVILKAGEPKLTVEWLGADAAKPYHSLFEPEIRRLAEERLREFPPKPSN